MVECFCALATRELNDMRAYARTSINTLVHFLLQMNTYVRQQGPALQSEASLIILRNSWRWKEECDNLKQNKAQSSRAQSTHKEVHECLKDVTQTQQRPELPMVSCACMWVNTRYVTQWGWTYLWWSLGTLYLLACQVSYHMRLVFVEYVWCLLSAN